MSDLSHIKKMHSDYIAYLKNTYGELKKKKLIIKTTKPNLRNESKKQRTI